MSTWLQISIAGIIIGLAIYVILFTTNLKSNKDVKNGAQSTADQKKPVSDIRGWFNSHKDTIQTLVLVAIGIVAINVLCNKVGFPGWQNVYRHESFLWLNASLLIAVFLTLAAKKPVVKWVAGLIALIILVGGGRIWFKAGPAHTVNQASVAVGIPYTLKKGEVTDILLLEDIVSRDMVLVEVRFNKPDSLTEFSEWQKVEGGIRFPYPVTFVQYRALTDTFNVRVKAPRMKL